MLAEDVSDDRLVFDLPAFKDPAVGSDSGAKEAAQATYQPRTIRINNHEQRQEQ
jgi:hypothetical protein